MSLTGTVLARLPGGLASGAARQREAVLRPLTGREEELLAATEGDAPALRTTALLAACVERLGPERPGPEGIRALCLGDRESLLLQLRRATTGEALDCVLRCPEASCDERLDVRLRTTDLLLPAYDEWREWYEEWFETGSGRVRVRFRLPTGADQEAVAALARRDPLRAAHVILERCVERLVDEAGEEPVELSADTAAAVASRMARLDPQAELRLDVTCPSCGRGIDALLDTATFLMAEVGASPDALYEEVHTLACWYHWGESEILGLTAPKRRRYLDLIAERSAAPATHRSA